MKVCRHMNLLTFSRLNYWPIFINGLGKDKFTFFSVNLPFLYKIGVDCSFLFLKFVPQCMKWG